MKAVVSDSTILIGLAKIERMDLLQNLFQQVYIPDAVFKEVADDKKQRAGAIFVKKASWIIRKRVKDQTEVRFLTNVLGQGEAEALVLAKEMCADLILLDDDKARKSAISAGFNVIGVIGILLVAKRIGLIKSVEAQIERLRKAKFRISDRVVEMALSAAGEPS